MIDVWQLKTVLNVCLSIRVDYEYQLQEELKNVQLKFKIELILVNTAWHR